MGFFGKGSAIYIVQKFSKMLPEIQRPWRSRSNISCSKEKSDAVPYLRQQAF